MSRWLVTSNGGAQYPVNGLGELKKLARDGQLRGSDMIQPPGTNEWMYASEIPELGPDLEVGASKVSSSSTDFDDDIPVRSSNPLGMVIGLVALLVMGGAGYLAVGYANKLPDHSGPGMVEELGYSKMIVTGENAQLQSKAEDGAPPMRALKGGEELELLAKRGSYYKSRTAEGQEGWVAVDKVLPLYMLGGGEVIKEKDPLYNPERYVIVMNAGWMQLPEQKADQITVFQFQLKNNSDYDMADLVMTASIMDAKGHDLGKVEFKIDGIVPAHGATMVGTLTDEKGEGNKLVTEAMFKSLAEENPDLNLQYNAGVEVRMDSAEFTEAEINIVELRAIPKGE